MKSIKLKIVIWIIALFAIVGSCIAQDSVISTPPFDTMKFGITVETSPVEVTVKTEDLEKNEPLQKSLEAQGVQTDVLNQNLQNLVETIAELPHSNIMATQEMLDLYNVKPSAIDNKYTTIHTIWYSILFLYLVLWLIFTIDHRGKLYWSTKNKTRSFAILALGSFIIGWLMPKLLCLILIDNFHLWSNIEKLF